MTIYRNPVVGSPIGSQRLHCIGDACAAKFNHHPTGSDMFVCPNRGFSEGKCSSAAFVYPRKRKSVPAAKSRDGDGIFKHYHQGIDLARVRGREAAGDPIYSVTAGTVVHVDREDDAGYGFIIIVQSDVPWQSDPLYFAYAHCDSIPERWCVGSPVAEKDVVGTVGSTGNPGPNGPHLHFEVRVSSHMPEEHEWKSESTQTELLLRIEPLEVLERLGPWGMSKVYFPVSRPLPEGYAPVALADTKRLHTDVESTTRGGYFPLGANNDWHGGVHLQTTPAQTLIAPFDAKIVALRLDPDPTSSLAAAGHVNFILLKHEISEPAAKLLENKPIAVDPKAKPKPESVGRGGTNEPDLVLQAKSGLHTRMSPSTGAPFYDPASVRELVDPYPDDELYASIEAFQASIKPPKPAKKKKKKNAAPPWPDGLMTVDGYTWRSLFGSSPKVPMHKDGAPDGGDPHALEPARPDGGDPRTREPTDPGASDKPKPTPEPGEKEDPKRTIFALLMHLGPLPLDETTTERFSWLGRATATPRSNDEAEKAAAKAKQERAEDRAEAKYTLKGRVGFPPPSDEDDQSDRNPGLEEDITWVQKRLVRLAGYAGPVDGVWTEEMRDAIREFQIAHTKYYAAHPEDAPGFVMPKSKKSKGETYKALSMTRVELFDEEDDPAIDAVLAARMAERDDLGRARIVSGLSIPVRSGDPLWISGLAEGVSLDEDDPRDHRYDQLHWEIFSEHKVTDWEEIVDGDENRTANLSPELYEKIEIKELSPFAKDRHLVAEEVIDFYGSGRAEFLRRRACRFRNEWGADVSAWVKAITDLGFDPDGFGETLRAYQIWPDAKDVLPKSPHVWHYNPIEFLSRYSEILEQLAPKPVAPPEAPCTLRVEVRYADGQPWSYASVALAYVGEGERVMMADVAGVAEYVDIPAGAGFVWIAAEATAAHIFTLDGGDHETIQIDASIAGPAIATGMLVVLVRDHLGVVIADAQVRVTGSDGEPIVRATGSDGIATFVELPPDLYDVRVSGAERSLVPVSAGVREECELIQDLLAAVTVRVTYPGGSRASGTEVCLSDGSPPLVAVTDDDGLVEFTNLLPGSYMVYLSADGDIGVDIDLVALEEQVVDLEAPNVDPVPDIATGVLRVTVRDDDGRPVSGERVVLLDDSNQQVLDDRSDIDGKVVFGELQPGTYGVSSDHARADQLGLAIRAGAPSHAELRIPATTGKLLVNVIYTDGEPVYGTLKVTTRWLAPVTSKALQGSGDATFSGLDAGEYVVFLDGFDDYAVTVDLPAGGTVPVTLILPGLDG